MKRATLNIEKIGGVPDRNFIREHIRMRLATLQQNKYNELVSFIDSRPFNAYIVGHSCGFSDRVLLKQIFENENCNSIEILYHKRADGTDNFQQVLRKSQNILSHKISL